MKRKKSLWGIRAEYRSPSHPHLNFRNFVFSAVFTTADDQDMQRHGAEKSLYDHPSTLLSKHIFDFSIDFTEGADVPGDPVAKPSLT